VSLPLRVEAESESRQNLEIAGRCAIAGPTIPPTETADVSPEVLRTRVEIGILTVHVIDELIAAGSNIAILAYEKPIVVTVLYT
jgi:hypothetical protein